MANKIAKIEFKDGRTISVELFADKAPKSVENFINLANSGFYKGLVFHRIIEDFMIQGGGMDTKGVQKKCPSIYGEFASNGYKTNTIKHEPGVISMARTSVKDSASSQFFICTGETSFLDGEYAAFGKTVSQKDTDTAIEISKVKTGAGDVPVKQVVINDITVK
jgi:peptidyl-prolyl cis-trans isomerase B (cyclophilin B)